MESYGLLILALVVGGIWGAILERSGLIKKAQDFFARLKAKFSKPSKATRKRKAAPRKRKARTAAKAPVVKAPRTPRAATTPATGPVVK